MDKYINYFKGRCFYGIGDIMHAIDSYTNSIILDKNNYECYFYRGITYISNNQTDNACYDFEYACKNNYHNACNRFNYHCK